MSQHYLKVQSFPRPKKKMVEYIVLLSVDGYVRKVELLISSKWYKSSRAGFIPAFFYFLGNPLTQLFLIKLPGKKEEFVYLFPSLELFGWEYYRLNQI